MSSSESVSSASRMRRSLPNWFISTLVPGYPFTFSNKSAGPPAAYPFRAAFTSSLGDTVSDLGNFENRIDLFTNAFQFPFAIQPLDPVS